MTDRMKPNKTPALAPTRTDSRAASLPTHTHTHTDTIQHQRQSKQITFRKKHYSPKKYHYSREFAIFNENVSTVSDEFNEEIFNWTNHKENK